MKKFGGMERVYVDNIKLKGNDMGSLEKSNVVIVFRVPVSTAVNNESNIYNLTNE